MSTDAGSPLPGPVTDLDSEPFFAGLRRGVIVVQECAVCGRRRFGRLGTCPYCSAPGGTDLGDSGAGVVHAFVRVQRARTPAMIHEVPCAIATVALDAGVRMVGRVDPPEAAAIGVRVTPRFVGHDEWTELRFTAS